MTHPEPEATEPSGTSPSDVRQQLARILASDGFANSPRLTRLLEHLVERSLNGDAHSLREYAVGIDVFDRGAEFDPSRDTIVRVFARRLRLKLANYYADAGKHDPLRIVVPKGAYVAEFVPSETPARKAVRSIPVRTLAAGVALSAVIAALVLFVLPTDTPPTVESDPLSDRNKHVAVLPFANASGDSGHDYVGHAMAEEIWSRLSAEPGLQLTAMTSARAAVRHHLTVNEIATRLDARYVVEGSVVTIADQVRVSVRIIDANQGTNVWSERYEGNLSTIQTTFGLYEDIARDVAARFDVVLGGDGDHVGTDSVAAYLYVEQAWYNFRAGLTDRVAPLIEHALEADPNFSRAHAFKGWLLRNQTDNRVLLPVKEGYQRALWHIERSLDLEPDRPATLVQKAGIIARTTLDYRGALALIERAETLGVTPQYAVADKARILFLAGRLEAALDAHQVAAADDPMHVPMRVEAVPILWELGETDRAFELLDDLQRLAPGHPLISTARAQLSLLSGRLQYARELLGEGELRPGLARYVEAMIDLKEGRPERFRALTHRHAQLPNANPLQLVTNYWLLSNYAEHLRWCDVMFAEGFLLDELPRIVRTSHGYWDQLDAWAAEQPDKRFDRLAEHRSRIAGLIDRMRLD